MRLLQGAGVGAGWDISPSCAKHESFNQIYIYLTSVKYVFLVLIWMYDKCELMINFTKTVVGL